MTICLAAIATETLPDGSKSDVIVTASDRMITLGGTTEYVWGEQTKTFWFSKSIMAMSADDPDQVLEVYRSAHRALNGKPLTVERVARKVAQKFYEHRQRRNERLILGPHGLTFDTLIKNQRTLDQTVISRLVTRLYGDDGVLNATMIVAGLNDREGHIYLIDDPGQHVCCDAESFAAIGLGREHAESVFTESMYTHHTPWTEVVLLAYLAKSRAEAAPGVGEDTDLYWIKSDGYGYVEPRAELMGELAKVRHDRDQRMRRALDVGHQRLRTRIEEIRRD